MIVPKTVHNRTLYLSDGRSVNTNELRKMDVGNTDAMSYPVGVDPSSNVIMSNGRMIPKEVVMKKVSDFLVAEHYANANRQAEHYAAAVKRAEHYAAAVKRAEHYNRQAEHYSADPSRLYPEQGYQTVVPGGNPNPPSGYNYAPVVPREGYKLYRPVPATAEGYRPKYAKLAPEKFGNPMYVEESPKIYHNPIHEQYKAGKLNSEKFHPSNPAMSSVGVPTYDYDSRPSPFFAADNERYFPIRTAYTPV